jgi:hypothetical protein
VGSSIIGIASRMCCCVGLVAVVNGSAHAQLSTAQRDSSVFVAIVRSLVVDSAYQRGGGVQVDPRPAVDADERTAGETSSTPNPASLRRAILEELGVRIGDGKRPKGCGGIMTPYSPGDEAHRGCPTDEKVVASIGLPRDTTVSGSADRRLTTTMVAVLEIGPHGFSVLYYDYTLEATAPGWKVVNRRLGRFVE